MLYRIMIFAMTLITLLSCSTNDAAPLGARPRIESFEVLCKNEWIAASVDNERGRIVINGVENTSLITDVRYTLTGEGTLYPAPASWIGQWDEEESFLLKWGDQSFKYTVTVEGLRYSTVTVSQVRRQKMCLGVDAERLWYWRSPLAEELADLAVGELRSSYVRVAINCEYEREEGNVQPAAYDKILEVMDHMKRINPDIAFFASPRPLAEAYDAAETESQWNGKVPWSPYPTWVLPVRQKNDGSWETVDSQLKIDKLIRYYADYLNFMHAKGHKITYLDATNEKQVITPALNKALYEGLKASVDEGVHVPQMVVPSSWSREQGVAWLSSVDRTNGELDCFTIAATHNTSLAGTAEAFAEKARELGKSPWNTELHGWVGIDTRDEVLNSESFWEHVRAGFEGIDTWLFYGPVKGKDHTMIWASQSEIVKSAKYEIFKQVVNNANGGYCYETDTVDERLITVAFCRDNVLSVWLLNKGEAELKDVAVHVGGRRVAGPISCIKWNAGYSKQGAASELTMLDEDRFVDDIAPETLCFYRLLLAE